MSALNALTRLDASRRSSSVRSGTHSSLNAMRYSVMSPPLAWLGPGSILHPYQRTAAARFDTASKSPASAGHLARRGPDDLMYLVGDMKEPSAKGTGGLLALPRVFWDVAASHLGRVLEVRPRDDERGREQREAKPQGHCDAAAGREGAVIGMGLLAVGQEPSRMVEVVADTRNDQTHDDPDHDAGEADERAVRQSRRLELRTVALAGIEADECASRMGSLSVSCAAMLPVGVRRSASSRFILSGIPDTVLMECSLGDLMCSVGDRKWLA